MRIFLIGFLFLIGSAASAKTVVLRAPATNAKDYQAFVLSSSFYEFPSRVILHSLPSQQDRDRLSARFAKAQLSFTDGSLSQAKDDFENIVALAETDQWGEEEQNVLLHSYFRLAQLSQTPVEVTEWLKKALAWAPLGQLNESYFPPPLVEQYKNMKAKALMVKADLSAFSDDFNYLMINGRIVDLAKEKKLELPDGPIRATFISDTFQPVTLQLAADQLAAAIPDKNPWVKGSCLKPQLYWQIAGLSAKPFFGSSCAPMKPTKPADLEVSFHPSSTPSGADPAAVTIPNAELNTSRAQTPFYKRTWFWVGVGAVVTTAVIVSLANSRSTNHPTYQEGF